MGPALRLTPLSPACGPRRVLDAWRSRRRFMKLSRAHRSSISIARRSRRCRFRRGLSVGPKTSAVPPGGSEIGLSTWASSSLPHCPEAVLGPRPRSESPTLPTLRPRGFSGLEFGLSEDAPGSIPRPRGISPSRRSGSKIPTSAPAFPPLFRKGQSPSRCLEGARRSRFGQARKRPVIHFLPECQWTRLDNSTARRRSRGLSPVALPEQPQTQRIELDEARRVALIVGAGVILERHVPL